MEHFIAECPELHRAREHHLRIITLGIDTTSPNITQVTLDPTSLISDSRIMVEVIMASRRIAFSLHYARAQYINHEYNNSKTKVMKKPQKLTRTLSHTEPMRVP